MPIYEYRCEKCRHELETLEKISDPPLTKCPECGKKSLKKKISAAGFRLKGGGWYETDFKSDRKRNVISADADQKSGGASNGDSTSGETSKSSSEDSTKSAAKSSESKSGESKSESKSAGGKSAASKSESSSGAAKSS